MGKFKDFLDKYLPENDKREDYPYWEESIANSGYTERDFREAAERKQRAQEVADRLRAANPSPVATLELPPQRLTEEQQLYINNPGHNPTTQN